MNEEQFLQLLNEVAKKAKPFHNELKPIVGIQDDLNETGLDSLDMLMCTVYLCEIYDVEDEKSKEMTGATPKDLLDFLEEWGRRKPSSLEEALGWFK